MGDPYEINFLRCNCHMRSPGSLCVLTIVCPVQHEPVHYPSGFGRCPFGCCAGPCRRRRALEQLTASLADLHGVNTGFVERHLDHTRLSTSPKSTEAHFRKLKTGSTAPYGPNNHRKIVQTRSAVLRPV